MFDALLTGGGARFNRTRFGGEIQRFERRRTGGMAAAGAAGAPASLDFFGALAPKSGATKQHAARQDKVAGGRKHGASKDDEDSARKHPPVDDSEGDQSGSEDADHDEGVHFFPGAKKSKSDGEGRAGVEGARSKKKGSKASHDAKSGEHAREALALFRKQMRISVAGDEVPAPAGSFEEMWFPKEAGWVRAGIEAAGWTEPTPIQMQAVPVMTQGRDVLACAPTGSGKTGAFVIPLFAVLRGPKKAGIRGLIISPTRELATQIFQQCQTLRAHSKMECKLLTKASAAAVADVQSSMGKKHDVLVSTPARVVTLLKERALDLSTVEVCVIDEADKLFEDGFVHQIDEVLAGCTHPRLQKALFSATIPPQVSSVGFDVLLLIVCIHGLGAVLRYFFRHRLPVPTSLSLETQQTDVHETHRCPRI